MGVKAVVAMFVPVTIVATGRKSFDPKSFDTEPAMRDRNPTPRLPFWGIAPAPSARDVKTLAADRPRPLR
jgi:hypothetical protein